eukprot:scaffold648010_cov47-Prasinocladus_malaysianus.AAC.2
MPVIYKCLWLYLNDWHGCVAVSSHRISAGVPAALAAAVELYDGDWTFRVAGALTELWGS